MNKRNPLKPCPRVLAIGALACAFVLSACTVGPDYKRPDVDLPTAYPNAATDATQAEPLRVDWWMLFNDPVLNDLVATALANNPDVRSAIARIEETDANLRAVNSAFLPEIDVGAGATRSRSSSNVGGSNQNVTFGPHNDFRLALSTSFEIDFWGKLRRNIEAARAQTISSRYAKDVVMLTLAGLTAQTYFQIRSLDVQIANTRVTLTTRDDTLNLIRRRLDAGIASNLEFNQATSDRADISSQLTALIRLRELAMHQLGVLTGKLDINIAPGNVSELPQAVVPPPELPSTLLERRPDILQAEQDLISANARIGIARAAMLPTISLTGAYGAESAALSTLFEGPSRLWSFGLGLTGPIFDAGRGAAITAAQEARQRQAVETYQKAIQTAFREVADALSNVRQLSASNTDLEISVKAAREAFRLANLRYDAGYSGFLDVLDAQRQLNIAELALVRNRQTLLSANVDLMRALGGGWYTPTPTAGSN